MPAQLFVDDSGGKGHSKHFVLAGLVSDSGRWRGFCSEWRECLTEQPEIPLFKMREAATLTGAFHKFTKQQRDDRLRKLAAIINHHVEFAIWTAIDLDAHANTWSKLGKPSSEPYFWCLHALVLGTCFDLWEECGWRERFEAYFDEQLIFGERARKWLPFISELMRHAHPIESALLPDDLIFCKDDDFPQIQAADLWAWCIRRNTDNPEEGSFNWLIGEMSNVSQSNYCNYYDLERMTAVVNESYRIAQSGGVPNHLVPLYKQTLSSKGRGK
jgi:hypothetical protein